MIKPPTKYQPPRFSEEKRAAIRQSIEDLLSYYQTNQIGNLPGRYPTITSIWEIPRHEYRGVLLADIFIASIALGGRITAGSDPTPVHRRLPSIVDTTVNSGEALGYAQRKDHRKLEESYAEILGVTQNELRILKNIGFFNPVVLEFDVAKIRANAANLRREGHRIHPGYRQTTPYLHISQLSDNCLDRLQTATGFDFQQGHLQH